MSAPQARAAPDSEARATTPAQQLRRSGGRQYVGVSPAPVHPMLQLQEEAGNQAVLALLRSGYVRAKPVVSQPQDPEEQEADRIAELVMRAPWTGNAGGIEKKTRLHGAPAGPGQLDIPTQSPFDVLRRGGQALPAAERAFFEPRFSRDFRNVRIHTDSRAAELARSIGARAFAVGDAIAFAPGEFRQQDHEGRKLLAHELAHVTQQSRAAAGSLPVVQRQAAPAPAPEPPVAGAVPLVPPEWVREPGRDDILTVVAEGRMLALPASGNIVRLRAPRAGVEPTVPLFTVPTIGKEGMVAVNVGGRIGFQIDAGGEPLVLYPAALAAIRQSLGIDSIRNAAVTHIHDDHVRALVATVQRNGIRPEGLIYPAAFAVNASAPGSTFARGLQALQADPALRLLGHGPGGAYQAIPTPAGGSFFRSTVQEGDATFDFYGLTAAFQNLQQERSAGQRQPRADTASLLTRVSFAQRPGAGMLYVGDLRGSDLTRFEAAMGAQAYQEMLRGVRVITGFQHHMGALESQGDRQGLLRLLSATYAQSGQLDVVVQSTDSRGNFSLNRSLISALTGMGIDVHVAKDPRAGQVGTVTYDSQGNIRIAGTGQVEAHGGSAEMRSQVRRLAQLNEAAEILTRYGRFVNQQYRYTDEVVRARDALRAAVESFMLASLANVKQGAAGRAQASLDNPRQQEQALQRVRATHPVEERLLPSYMESLRELSRQGPHRETLEREFAAARRAGRLSDAGIEALWEVEPEVARRLVGGSGMSRRAQRQAMAQLPGQPLPVRGRLLGGFLVVVTLAQEIAPLVSASQEASFAEDVMKSLSDIMWWQAKGVFPTMQGVNDRWWPRGNEWVNSPARIQQLLDSEDLDYLALTGIPDEAWDSFMIWASGHLRSYPDWNALIQRSTAIKGEGASITELAWSYRRGRIRGTTLGHEISAEWQYSERLTTILRAAAAHVVANTRQQITNVGTQPGGYAGPAFRDPDRFESTPAYEGAPQALGRKRFKPGVTPMLYTVYDQHSRRDFNHESVFYVFPASKAGETVPAGYVVVGGADYNTYIHVYNAPNRFTFRGTNQYGVEYTYARTVYPNSREVLLAREEDLQDVPP